MTAFLPRAVREQPPWDGLPVVAELPPAVRSQYVACRKRNHGIVLLCPYYADCADNCARGGAVLCERVIVAACGDGTVRL